MCVDACVQGTHTPLGKLSLVVKSANNFFHRFLSLNKKSRVASLQKKRTKKILGQYCFAHLLARG